MEKESHEENNHTVSGDFTAKRKPGRPRKHPKLDSDEQSLHGLTRRHNDEAMVGQSVNGVIEAAFEDGFLLSVNVGSSGNMLRGVVFKPGRCDPVSVDNDIAPNVPMIRRRNSDGSTAKAGRRSRYREKRGSDVRTIPLVPVPIQPVTIPENLVAPVALQPVNLHNSSGQVPVQDHMQTKTESHVTASGASNDKPFETLLTQVMEKGQVQNTAQVTEPESDEQAMCIEPLQAIHPVNPASIPKPIPSYGGGKMTELLQAMQENVKDPHFSQGL
ncbi:unnamed protein product [Cochlearia groenlandica]